MFETFYNSYLQHPLLLVVAPLVFLFIIPRGKSLYLRGLRLFTWLTILDPVVTGPVLQWLQLSSGAESAVSIGFVILGDFRWFFFFELFASSEGVESPFNRADFLRALALSFVVPVLQAVMIQVFPGAFENTRHTFLLYELMFFCLAVFFLVYRVPRFCPEVRELKRSLCLYALAYYALWASADVLILSLGDIGYALRVIPNLLYYSFFLPFVFWRSLQLPSLRRSRA